MAYEGLLSVRRGTTAACVEDIFKIHFPRAKSVLDCTYGAGRFWKWNHALDVTGVDIDPPIPVSVQADYRDLPFAPGQFDVMCFDPPFIFSKGLRRVIGTKRFFMGAERANPMDRLHSKASLRLPSGPRDLLDHYRRIFEQRTIARQGLIVKGQDLIVSKADWWSYNVMKLAEEVGLGLPTDSLIQHSPAARMRDPRWKHQRHFRRAHCIYLIWNWEPCCGKAKVAMPELQVVGEGADGVEMRGVQA